MIIFFKREFYNIGYHLLDILHTEYITNTVSSSQGVTSHITDFWSQPQIFILVYLHKFISIVHLYVYC